jgi:L-seryl-tRNA(Ser) seleniumtransferase
VKIPLYEDAGSGQLTDLSHIGVEDEPIISNLVSGGADLVSFSGDKLLGCVQAGLIVGRRGIVDRLRRHPLYRALRSDKIRLAALEATLSAYQKGKSGSEIPVQQMLALTNQEIGNRARSLLGKISNSSLRLELEQGESAVGGGAGPTADLPTTLITITHSTHSAQELENRLRSSSPPIITRISEQRVLVDLRTVFPDQETPLASILNTL